MSQNIEEQLSALLDGELAVEEEALLLRRLEREPEYRATLGRYGLIGQLMRDSQADPGAVQIGDRVGAALAGEAAYQGMTPDVTEPARVWSGVGKGLVGAGIAAAVAIVAVTAVGNLAVVTPDRGSNSVPALAGVAPSYTVPSGLSDNNVIAPARLTSYLVSHGEFSSPVSRRVMDSHIVRQTPETRTWNAEKNSANE